MKFYYVLILFIVSSLSSWAQQPTGDIQKDTALANQHYKEAVRLMNNHDTATKYLELFEKAILLYEAHPYQENLAIIQGMYAEQLTFNGQANKAESMVKKAIATATDEGYIKSPKIAHLYVALQGIYQGQPLKIVEYGEKALEIIDKNTNLYIRLVENMIFAYGSVNQLENILTTVQDLEKAIEGKNNNHAQKGQLYVYLGKVWYFYFKGNYEKAILFGEKMTAENDKLQTLEATKLASYYSMMGSIHTQNRDYDEALEHMLKAQEQIKYLANQAQYGNSYLSIANVYLYMENSEKLIEMGQKAIEYYSKDRANFEFWIGAANAYISTGYLLKGDVDEALKYNLLSKKNGLGFYAEEQSTKIFFEKKEYQKSIESLNKMLVGLCSQFKNANFYQNPTTLEQCSDIQATAQTLYEKGANLLEWGKTEKDEEKIKKAIATLELSLELDEERWQSAKGFDVAQHYINETLLNRLNFIVDGYYELYKIQPTKTIFNHIFYNTQKQKAIQLVETLTPSLLPKEVYTKEQSILQKMKTIGQELDLAKNKNDVDTINFYQDKLLVINQQLEEHLAETKQQYPKEYNHFYNTTYNTLEEVQTALPENTLLISYSSARTKESSYPLDGKKYRLVLTIGKKSKNITTITDANLGKKIKLLNELIQDRFAFQKPVREEFIDVSHELYKLLIEPIEAELEGKTRLMLVVEGELFYIPFELLLASNEKKPYHELDFLIKKYEVNYNYSATAFLKIQEKQTPQDKSLFAFAPVFNKGEIINSTDRTLDFMVDSLYRSFDKGAFAALPNTRKETSTIAKIIKSNGGKTNVLLEKKATKINFNQQINQQPYQFVHIATHGLVNFKQPKLSAFACYAKDETMESLVYANEIQFKNINADLVVLSSCESGIGQLVAGEGLIALNRSFIYAGAKNVMFSLWKVSDKYSSELMIDFYKYYFENTENASYTTALRQAKLKMLANPESAVPKYWSAFVLMGQ